MPSEMHTRVMGALDREFKRASPASLSELALAAMKAIQSYADEARDEWGFEHGDFEDVLKAEIAAAEESR